MSATPQHTDGSLNHHEELRRNYADLHAKYAELEGLMKGLPDTCQWTEHDWVAFHQRALAGEDESLEQPSPLHVVDSYTSDGTAAPPPASYQRGYAWVDVPKVLDWMADGYLDVDASNAPQAEALRKAAQYFRSAPGAFVNW